MRYWCKYENAIVDEEAFRDHRTPNGNTNENGADDMLC